MSSSGWIIMIIACGVTTVALAWCVWRVLSDRNSD